MAPGNVVVGNIQPPDVKPEPPLSRQQQLECIPTSTPYIMASGAQDLTYEMKMQSQMVEAYQSRVRLGLPGAAEGLSDAIAKLKAICAAQSAREREARARAEAQAQAETLAATQRAQAQAAARAEALARAQANRQAQIRAQAEAYHRAQMQLALQRQAQLEAQHQARIEAQIQAASQAFAQPQYQGLAQPQFQAVAQAQAQIVAQNAAQAQIVAQNAQNAQAQFGVPNQLNQPVNMNPIPAAGNLAHISNQHGSVTVNAMPNQNPVAHPAPAHLPAPFPFPAPKPKIVYPTPKVLLPPCLPDEVFPFTKLPFEVQLMIFKYAWESPDPLPAPFSCINNYQKQLEFYSDPAHLRSQLRGLFKLGALSQSIRAVAYDEYFKCTQLYLRYEAFGQWRSSDEETKFGSRELNERMTSLWDVSAPAPAPAPAPAQDAAAQNAAQNAAAQNGNGAAQDAAQNAAAQNGNGAAQAQAPLSPLKPLLEKYVQHVAWHVGPVFEAEQHVKMKECLAWLKTSCKGIKTLEIIVGFRSAHVRPKLLQDFFMGTNKFSWGLETRSVFQGVRPVHINGIKGIMSELMPKMKTGGALEKVVFTVEKFVKQHDHYPGAPKLNRMLARSDWWVEWKREVREKLGKAESVKVCLFVICSFCSSLSWSVHLLRNHVL